MVHRIIRAVKKFFLGPKKVVQDDISRAEKTKLHSKHPDTKKHKHKIARHAGHRVSKHSTHSHEKIRKKLSGKKQRKKKSKGSIYD